jgi:ferredoxin-NADP reductase
MNLRTTRLVKVIEAEAVTPQVRRFTLACADGERLPAWSGGSHIGVAFSDGERSWRNSYSLIGTPGETRFYQIAVRKDTSERSKGGSIFLHQQVAVGDTLEISAPNNYFPLARHARKHILIAGGIGITPFLAQMATLKQSGMPYELHYAFRERRFGAFCEQICAEHSPHARFYVSEDGHRLAPAALLADQPLGTHVYVCGPHSLISAVSGAAAEAGWPSTHVHFEEFTPPPISDAVPFLVHLPDLELSIKVGVRQTLLEALESAGVQIASSCRVGQCGTCEMRVLAGDPDHRDRCLSEGEMEDGKIIACVSRCRGEHLTLALPETVPV